MVRDPIARQPAYVVSWVLLVASFAVALFGPLWVAGLLLAASVGSFLVARRRVARAR